MAGKPELSDDDRELMTEQQPDRYEVGKTDLLERVADRIADEVPITMARQMLARDLVGQREGQATRRGNKFIKSILAPDGDAALPIDWYLYANEPVAIETEVVEDDKIVGLRRERVSLRAMQADDWRTFSSMGRASLQQRVEAESAMYDAAYWLADQQGAASFLEWAQRVAPREERDVS